MGSAALVFAMGRFLGPWTLGLVTACLIVLVNSNIDHNLKELGQDDGLFRGLLDINPNELRWKRAAQGGKKLKGLKKTKKSQTRTNKVVKGGKKNNEGGKSTKKRSNKNKTGKKQLSGNRKVNKAKKNKTGGKKWKGSKKNEKKTKKDSKKQKKNKGRGKKKKKCTKKNGCKGKKAKPTKAPKIDSKQTCPVDQADATCLLNAVESLVYEQKQLTNF